MQAKLAEAERGRALAELMVREADHRAKNTLAIAAGLLARQAAATFDPSARVGLETVHKRLSVLARAHGALQEASGQDAPVRNYLRALLEPLATEEISVRVAAPNVRWPVAILAPLGLLASEAVINALKHGYPDDRRGAIRVELAQSEDGSAQLTVADDGVGCATAPDEHLGMRLVRALARRLEGRLELRSPPEAGFTVLLGFPLEAASAAGVAPGR